MNEVLDQWVIEWEGDETGPSLTGYIALAPDYSERIPLLDAEGIFDEKHAQWLCDQLNFSAGARLKGEETRRWRLQLSGVGCPWNPSDSGPTGVVMFADHSEEAFDPESMQGFELDPEFDNYDLISEICSQLNSVPALRAQLAAKDAEIAALKARIIELEKWLAFANQRQ